MGASSSGAGAVGFEEYLATHGPALQRYAFVLTGNEFDAEDLVQSALIKAYRQWRRISRIEAPHAYVRRIVTRCFIDARRRRSAAAEQPSADVPDSADPVDRVERTVTIDALIRALAVLTPQQRAVLTLRYLLDMPDGGIATELGCSAATVRTHASRGLHQLRVRFRYPDMEVDHE
jgi:RNA polymerase sigma-70 factor (sigma-E family)